MCVDYVDYDEDVTSQCVISPLTSTDTDLPVYVTAFQSRDPVACSNASASSTAVHVVSVTSVEGRTDEVRRRLPRIRVNIVSSAGSLASAASTGSEGLHVTHTHTHTHVSRDSSDGQKLTEKLPTYRPNCV